MSEIFSRTEKLIGAAAMDRLRRAKILVFGVGGVGSYVVEALARSGVGGITAVDGDVVAESNINRQLIALHSTVGMDKVAAEEMRVKDINPEIDFRGIKLMYSPETADEIDFSPYSCVVDAVDTVTAKLLIIERAKAAAVPVISCMGTGNKLRPELFEIADISETSVCPLARVMRRELKKRGIGGVRVLYSKEPPAASPLDESGRPVPASVAFAPSAAGLIIAAEVVREIAGIEN